MATAPAAPGKYRDAPAADAFLPQSIWRAPLVPAALAITAGIVLDRYAAPPLLISVAAAAGGLAAWLCTAAGSRTGLPLVYLALAGIAFGAGYHHYRRDFAADDVSHLAAVEPQLVQVRGLLDEEPVYSPAPPPDPLRSLDRGGHSACVLRLTELYSHDRWLAVSGRARLLADGTMPDLHVGDEVEVIGRLSLPAVPANPGEFDYAESLRDQGIGVVLSVRKTAGVTRLGRGWTTSPRGWLAVLRGWGQEALTQYLPPQTRGVGIALLLGEGAPMTRDDWDKYLRTGVIHVLAISGQHLVVLAAFLWLLLPRLGVRQRHAAVIVALFLLGYSLLTGGRPPVMRSAAAVCAICGALVLRRRVLKANLFALAWLVVALLNPTDLFTAGCQLSFLSVAVLAWGTRKPRRPDDQPADPLAQLIAQSRPAWQRGLVWVLKVVGEAYAVCALVWLTVTPLAASRFHVVAPPGIVLGPPLVLLTSLALLFGFVLLLAAAVCPPLAAALGLVVGACLTACEFLVDRAKDRPWAQWYIGDIPEWWLWVFYLGLLAVLSQGPLRRHWRAAIPAGMGWLCVGLLAGAARLPDGELRCAFLAVGHGGCTVLEAPDGRVLLYDAGALGGPDLTRRQIAPYLWARGIRRVDEVLLSHADLDHFNGLESLLNYFAVGQVTCTPTFADKATSGVRHTLAELERRGVPLRVVKAGDVLSAGDVRLEVLHPPASGPEGNENARSLVLQVRHAGHTLLLTGDLEGAGQEMVLRLPARRVEVLMAPHHGSPAANTPDLARWARPQVVVACREPPRGSRDGGQAYRDAGARYLSTGKDGAVVLRSHASGLVVETFRTGERFVVRAPAERKGANGPP
jgi:competence protein ComEC